MILILILKKKNSKKSFRKKTEFNEFTVEFRIYVKKNTEDAVNWALTLIGTFTLSVKNF